MQRKTVVSSLQAACLLCILTSTLMASDPLDTWTWRNPVPNGNSINAVTYANGLIVGVGNWGTIMTSTNLATDRWVQSPNGTNTSTLNAIAYGNGTFVVGTGDSPDGNNAKRFLTSTDGTNWFTQTYTNTSSGRAAKALAYGAGLFVASFEKAVLWSSPDGTNWTQRYASGNTKHNLNAITYRPDVGFVAVGDSILDSGNIPEVRTSPDGINWFLQTGGLPNPTPTFAAITWGWVTNWDLTVTTNFVATGTTGTIATSPDGTNWATHPSYTAVKLYGTAFNPGVGYIAVGTGGVIQTSPDGTNWFTSFSDITNPLNVPGNNFAAATCATDLGYFIGVGSSGMVETSPTGVGGTWTAEFLGRPENLTGVARGSNNFVVVGNVLPPPWNNSVVLTSANGSSWKVRTTSNTTLKLNNVAYGAGTFVAVGNSGAIVTSSDDGAIWTVRSSGVAAHLYGVSYTTNSVTNLFIATGASGSLVTSPDGITWTAQTSGAGASSLYSSAYGAGIYLVVGAGGVIRSSPDGITWSPVTSPATKDFNGILYNAANSTNNFIAVGASGGIFTSPDGINWTARTTPYGTSPSFSCIAYGSGRFVVGAGSAPGVLISTNGVDWTTQFSPSSSAFKAIAWAADTFVAVAGGGSIVQAGAIAVARPQIQYSYAGGTLTLTWSGGGTLQASSPDVSGTYTNVSGAVSPYAVTPLSEPSMYFRVQQP